MAMLRQARDTLNKFLAIGGLRLARTNIPTRPWPEFFKHTRLLGFKAETIIDVGVFTGTPELYEAFPDAKLFLFDPDPACKPHADGIITQRQNRGKYWQIAAGSQAGTVDFYSRANGSSSLSVHDSAPDKKITVQKARIDKILNPELAPPPVILKIDVEGHELDVIDGCTGIIDCVEMIILETRFFKYGELQPEFADVIAAMRALGFVVYDMLSGYYRPTDGVLDFVDLVFVKENGLLRSKISRAHYKPLKLP